jgi:hypothetical protein
MLKAVAILSFASAMLVSPISAFAVSGTSSSYGTDGYGPKIPTRSLSTFDRHWNHANESRMRARESAEWLRQHGKTPF